MLAAAMRGGRAGIHPFPGRRGYRVRARSRTLIGLVAALALCALSAAFVHQAEAATPRAVAGPLQATQVGVNQVLAVPYYAWNNRGPVDMAVWLPVH